MLSCWNEDPAKRLMFTELRAKFDQMLQTDANCIYFLPVNNGQAYYKIENAPEGMSLQRSPVLLQVTPASNQTGLPSPAAEYSPLSSLLHGKSPNCTGSVQGSPTPSRASLQRQRSPRSLSPSQEYSNRRPSPPGASEQASRSLQRPTSMLLVNKRQKSNVYVDDPSKLAVGGNAREKARPASMLASWKQMESKDSEGVCSNGVTNPTFFEGEQRSNNQALQRPSSMILNHDQSSEQGNGSRDPRYVKDPSQYSVLASSVPNGTTQRRRDEIAFEMRDVSGEAHSPFPERSTPGSGTPGIQISMFQDS